jgi:zinc protease
VTEAIRHHLHPDATAVAVYRPRGTEPVMNDVRGLRALVGHDRPAPLPVSPPRQASPVAAREAEATFEREEARVRVYRTPARLPVLVRRKPGSPIVHIGVQMLGGAVHEDPAEAGLTTLLAHTMLKGTIRRDATQVAEDAEMLGGTIGVGVGSESLGWSMAVPTRHLAAAVELLADVIEQPLIPDAAFETERAAALAGLALLKDDMFRYPTRLALRAAFPGHPYGIPSSGSEETVSALTVERAREWHGTRVLGAPALIGIVGDVDPDEAANIAARAFSRLGEGRADDLPRPSWPSAPALAAEPREKAQTALSLLFPGPARDDDDRFAANLIAAVASGLGGRFFDELRDRQSLAYTVMAYASERRLAGLFGAYIATSPDLEDVARRGLLAEFAKLREEPISDEEIERAKTYTLGTHAIRQQSGGAVLGEITDAWLFGSLRELDEYEERVRGVTAADMQRIARKYFDESRMVQGIVRGVGKAV